MRWLVLIAAAGCATAPDPVAAPVEPAPQTLDDAAARARAHAFFEIVDRRDPAAFRTIISDGFVLFEDGRAMRPALLARFWKEQEKPPRERTCASETIHRSAGAIVYLGDCKEHQPGHGKRSAEDWQGWNTVVLVPEGDEWKVALWQWQRSA